MRFCQEHWDKLRAAIAARGLEALVPDNGEKALAVLERTLSGEQTIDSYDPLMNAHWAIIGNLARAGGPGTEIYLMQLEGCPLCEANKQHAAGCTDPECGETAYYDVWIDSAADEQVGVWRSLNAGSDG